MHPTRILGLSLLTVSAFYSAAVHAEVKALSRANCPGFVNESITYDRPLFRRIQGSAASKHVPQGNIYPKHNLGAPNNGGFAWRFRAGDQSDPERMLVRGTTREFLTDFPTYGTPLSSTVRSLNGNHDETEISSHVAHHGPPDGVNTRIIGASRRRWPMVERSRDAGSREG